MNAHHGGTTAYAPQQPQTFMTECPCAPGQQPVGAGVAHPPPKAHRHVKRGRHGEYRVFCVDDYNKLKREMKLASTLTVDKDAETLQEKVYS